MDYALCFVLGAILGIVVTAVLIGKREPAATGTIVAEAVQEPAKVEPVYVQQPTHWYNPVSRKPERRA